MALFDIETFEAGGGIDIIDELTGMEKPETSELPKTDKERKENIERFRKFGYIIDQSIEDVFVMMKTERFSYKQNGVLKKYSRLVPVFDLSKASGKTIEELNAKIYGDNSEKVLSRKWKGGYVGVMESGKIVYKSWKSMNFSTKNLIKETVSEATQQQTTGESGTAGVSNTPTTNSNFNDWIKIGQNSDEDLVIPYARKGSNVKPENGQQIDQTISEPSAQQEVKPVAKDAEQVESSEKLQSLSRVLDVSQVSKSDYPLLESIIAGITNESSDTYKKIVFRKLNQEYIITNTAVYDTPQQINLGIQSYLELSADMNGYDASQTKVIFSYDSTKGRFVIRFAHPKGETQSKDLKPQSSPTTQDTQINNTEKGIQTSAPVKKEVVVPKNGNNGANRATTPKNIISNIGPVPKLNDAQPWLGKVRTVIYEKIQRNPDIMNKMMAIDDLLGREKFTSKELNFLTDEIRTVGSGGSGYNRVQYSKIIDSNMRKNNIPKNDSLKTCVIYSLDIKMNNIRESKDAAEGLIEYFTQNMKIQD